MLTRNSLHRYQQKMVDWVIDNPKSALYVDMGLGKTVATLTAIADLFAAFEIGRVLVVAPLRVALSTWPTELRKWQHTQHLTHAQLAGLSAEQRRVVCMQDRSQIHFVNRELVEWLVRFYRAKWPYDMVVVDESSSFKSPASKRFKSLVMVQHAIGINRLVELTGTPTSTGLADLWSQIYLLDSGQRLGYSFGSFKKRYFETCEYTRKMVPRGNAESVIHDKLKDLCLRLAADDYLNMPEKITNTVEVCLSDAQYQTYRTLAADFLLELETGVVTADFAAALSTKLLQYCNGAMYLDDATRWEGVHNAKLEALDTVIEEAAGNPVLVAYQFRADRERIVRRYPDAVVLQKDPDTIDRWNRGHIPILVAHPASAGHGLNLQHGGHIIAWFGLPWSLELYQQYNARLHRQGQTRPVFVHELVVKNTIEDVVKARLMGHLQTQDALLNALRATLRGET